MKTFKTVGIVIKRRNYGEADKILTIFTKYYGKIQVKAVGIRRIPSRRAAHVELLNHSMLSLYRGRHMPILTEAEVIENFFPIKDDLDKVGLAFHLCELIDGLCPENQENTKVYYLLKNILTNLAKNSRDKSNTASKSILEFEIELLTTLGYWNKTNELNEKFDMRDLIENILERRLKSYDIFAKL